MRHSCATKMLIYMTQHSLLVETQVDSQATEGQFTVCVCALHMYTRVVIGVECAFMH